MSMSPINMLQTKGQMQAQDLELKQNQITSLGKNNMSEAEKEKKLREACEGFESIFIQKMWQQMRATLPQENPLVGREEKFWQSMYDQELSKKMASSGGIGLADMMYDQLSQNLVSASRTTADNASKAKGFEIAATPLMPKQNLAAVADLGSERPKVQEAQKTFTSQVTSDIYEGAAPSMGQNVARNIESNSINTSQVGPHMSQVATNGNMTGAPSSPQGASSLQGASSPLVEQYLSSLISKQNAQAMQNGQSGQPITGTGLTGPELARQAQLTATNAPPAHGVLPAQNTLLNANVGATGAALLQSQISGQPMENTQPHIIRTTYTTNIPESERSSRSNRDRARQLLTSGQPMVQSQIAPNYAYGANQTNTSDKAQASNNSAQASPATTNVQTLSSNSQNIEQSAAQSATPSSGQAVSQNAAQSTNQVAQGASMHNLYAPLSPTPDVDES